MANFKLEILSMIAAGNTVFVKLRAPANDLDVVVDHLFDTKDSKIISFHTFDATKKKSAATSKA